MKYLLFLWLCFSVLFCNAQQEGQETVDLDTVRIPYHSAYIELGGNALLYSLNYERIILRTNLVLLSMRFGAGYLSETILTPLMLNTLIGRKKHKLEIDIGATGLWDLNFNKREKQKEWIKQGYPLGSPYVPFFRIRPTATIGYRYQSNCGLFYKTGLTIFYKMGISRTDLVPWGSIGVGYFFGYKQFHLATNKTSHQKQTNK